MLKKSILTDERFFLGPLVRCLCGDVRDHIVSHRNDHRPPYRSYRGSQRRRPLKIDIREIFGGARFSTFATVSARNGHRCRVSVQRRSLRLVGDAELQELIP
jgi:hypothetical protein